MSIKDRVRRLEKTSRSRQPCCPYVVDQREDETFEQACDRVFAGFSIPCNLRVVVAPPQLSEAEWVERYSP
jgi:hypothetical protein